MKRRFKDEEDMLQYILSLNRNFTVIEMEGCFTTSRILVKCNIDGNEWYTNVNRIHLNCPKCVGGVRLTLDEVKTRCSLLNNNIKIVDDNYKNSHSKLKCMCGNGHIFYSTWDSIRDGSGCTYCNGKRVSNKNSIYQNRPDLLVYFENPEDAKDISTGAMKIVSLRCNLCGFKKDILINSFARNGFSCPNCNLGNSIGNHLLFTALSIANIKFKEEFSKPWSNGKRYDFYIEECNTIIELHGAQHYKQVEWFMNLEDQIKNDITKREVALTNGISKYIEIDISANKNVTWLYNRIKNEVFNHLKIELPNVNDVLLRIYNKEDVRQVCEMYNKGEKTIDISNVMNISKHKVLYYLKVGTELGWCNYLGSKKYFKKVEQLDKDTLEVIKIWDSIKDACRGTGARDSIISSICKGIKNNHTSAGFKWRYHVEEYG